MKSKTAAIIATDTTFSQDNFHALCDGLAAQDSDLQRILERYGYPPMWTRSNTLETLVHIVLEQQVSLASALAALGKLKERMMELTPEGILALTDEQMRACYVSRQKMGYLRGLAKAIADGTIDLAAFPALSSDAVRQELIQLKGIGNWTIDVYLMFVLQRADIFPIGDLAAVNALKRLKGLPRDTPREVLIAISAAWQPYRTVACMMLWHDYLANTNKNYLPQNGPSK